jgi:hypothetical protein
MQRAAMKPQPLHPGAAEEVFHLLCRVDTLHWGVYPKGVSSSHKLDYIPTEWVIPYCSGKLQDLSSLQHVSDTYA